ncbi:MAG: acetyltransferase, family [Herbinix sp.]|nr:acetyltransferase, family [Herbinix sp.]
MGELNITTERVTLKGIRISDAEAMFQYRSNPQIYLYQDWKPETLEEVKDFINRNSINIPNTPETWYQLGIFHNETKELIGDIGIHFIGPDNSQIEIGYTLSLKYQSKGYAFEAVTGAMDYLFNNLNKHRISASVDPRNTKSIALLERIGMRKEAHFRKSLWFNNEWADDIVYAILREEWMNNKQLYIL